MKRRAKISRWRELLAALRGVEGWLGWREAKALHDAALGLPGPEPVAVEIGSWKGRSTIALALAFRARGAGVVVAVDPHEGSRPHELFGEADTYGAFTANIAAAGVAGHVRPVRMRSPAAAEAVEGPVDLLFVDGSHRYEDVAADLDGWTPLLREGAVVACHDIQQPGVRRAVEERVRDAGPLRRGRVVQRTLFARYAA